MAKLKESEAEKLRREGEAALDRLYKSMDRQLKRGGVMHSTSWGFYVTPPAKLQKRK